MSILSKTINQQ